jgi:hypothetical protein
MIRACHWPLLTGWRAVAILAALANSGTDAHAGLTQLIAVSNTAISITGDVSFTPSSIVFANHAVLPLTEAGRANGLTWAESMRGRPVILYKVNGEPNPKLLNGNFLCAANTPPSFISVLEQGSDVYVTVFSGKNAPTAKDFEQRICAGFTYSLGLSTGNAD